MENKTEKTELHQENLEKVAGGVLHADVLPGQELSGIFKYVTEKERIKLIRLSERHANATTDEGVSKAYNSYYDFVEELNQKYAAQLSEDSL